MNKSFWLFLCFVFGFNIVNCSSAQSVYSTPYSISTLAGGATGYSDGTGASASFIYPKGITVDSTGNVYVADTQSNIIRKITQSGVVSTLAGSAAYVGSADGNGSFARFNAPTGIAVDGSGNVYVSDTLNFTVRKVTPAGIVTTIAGITGLQKAVDGTGTSAGFNYPVGMVIDSSGNLYVCEPYVNLIRKITPNGVVTSINLSSSIYPQFIAIDNSGNFYVTCMNSYVVYKVTSTGQVSLYAGTTGLQGNADGSASSAQFGIPYGITVDAYGSVFVSDQKNETIRKISNGVVSTIAGKSLVSISPFSNGIGSAATFSNLYGLAVDKFNNIYIGDIGAVRLGQMTTPPVINTQPVPVTECIGYPATLSVSASGVGSLSYQWYKNNIPISVATSATLSFPSLSLTDAGTYTVTVTNEFGLITSSPITLNVGNGYNFSTYLNTSGIFNNPWGMVLDIQGNLYVADSAANCIYKVTPNKSVTVFAGSQSYSGYVDGIGTNARFNQPYGIAIDSSGSLYVSEMGNHTLRKITSSGIVTTLAGTSSPGSQDGTGVNARFSSPAGVAVDPNGNVYVVDMGLAVVKKVTPDGVVTTIAGSAYSYGSVNGQGSTARFNSPAGIIIDALGNIYVADTGNSLLRKITSSGLVTTLAGTAGMSGGIDGVGSNALFAGINGLAIDSSGNIFATDSVNQTIRRITSSGVVTTIGGLPLQSGLVNGNGNIARFNNPYGVTIDNSGNLYFYENANQDIRIASILNVPSAPTNVSALAGNGQATVSFTAPSNNGGALISSYTVTATPLGGGSSIQVSGTSSPILVTGLTNGVFYTFTVNATNNVGVSANSNSSASTLVEFTTPGIPTNVKATAGSNGTVVTFAPPSDNGGSAITGYTVTATPIAGGPSTTFNGDASPIIYSGLQDGVGYTVTVAATNINGTGTSSQSSAAFAPITQVPGPPVGVNAVAQSTGVNGCYAVVGFNPPLNNGNNSLVTNYTATATSTTGGSVITATGLSSPIQINGLINNTEYIITVSATNSNGTGTNSLPSNPIIPKAPLGIILSAIPSTIPAGSNLTVTASAIGTPVINYKWQYNGSTIQTGNGITVSTIETDIYNGAPYQGAMASTLKINSASISNAGEYKVIVTDGIGGVSSGSFTLGVTLPATHFSLSLPNSFISGQSFKATVTALDQNNNVVTNYNGKVQITSTDPFAKLPANFQLSNGIGSFDITLYNYGNNSPVPPTNGVQYITATDTSSFLVAGSNSISGTIGVIGNYALIDKNNVVITVFVSLPDVAQTYPAAVLPVYPNAVACIQIQNGGIGWIYNPNTQTFTPPTQLLVLPSIINQPLSQTVNSGAIVTFSVNASGSAPLVDQWYFNGVSISGAITSNYTINSVNEANAGTYYVVVSNNVGSVTSNNAILTLKTPTVTPVINMQPASITVNEGSSATFNVSATGSPLSYQWYYNGTSIPGATSSSYTIPAVSSLNNGGYYVVINGYLNSLIGYLWVNTAPTISSQPKSGVISLNQYGSSYTFNVVASGATPLNYQWYFNGLAIAGATSANYSITSLAPTNFGSYKVIVSNTLGSVTSNTAILSAIADVPAITSASSVTCYVGNAFTYQITATNSPTSYSTTIPLPLGLSLNANTGMISGVPTTNGISIVPITATNAGGTTVYPVVFSVITSYQAPVFTVQPLSQSVNLGGIVTFTTNATGNPPPAFQWYFNGSTINAATSSNYSIPSVNTANAGSYYVVATNSVSSVSSNSAVLTVNSINGSPVISVQPISQTINTGSALYLSTTASGQSLGYQWYINGLAISGATSSTYSVPSVSASNAGNYTCVVSNAISSVTTSVATIVVNPVAPLILIQPISQSVKSGNSVTLSVSIIGLSPSYQWYFNGVAIAGATSANYTIPAVNLSTAGAYTVKIVNGGGSITSNVAYISSVGNPGRLINLSVLSMDGPGSQLLTVGFVNGGSGTSGSQTLLIRGSGPALSNFSVAPVLPDPVLTVFSGQNVVATNDNWGSSVSNATAVTNADASTGAFALNNTQSLDAALVQSLSAINGGYTVQISGKGSSSGFAIAEIYDSTPPSLYSITTPRLTNVSCLEQIPVGGSLTAGFVIGGDSTEKVLIRASGPTLSLSPFNVQGVIQDPKLTVFNSSSNVIATNSGWGGESGITAANVATGAFQFVNAASKDSAVILTLAPGLYTVQATSASGASGVTLIEVYEVPSN
jgi:sugar lactone lactonase YvrE